MFICGTNNVQLKKLDIFHLFVCRGIRLGAFILGGERESSRGKVYFVGEGRKFPSFPSHLGTLQMGSVTPMKSSM